MQTLAAGQMLPTLPGYSTDRPAAAASGLAPLRRCSYPSVHGLKQVVGSRPSISTGSFEIQRHVVGTLGLPFCRAGGLPPHDTFHRLAPSKSLSGSCTATFRTRAAPIMVAALMAGTMAGSEPGVGCGGLCRGPWVLGLWAWLAVTAAWSEP